MAINRDELKQEIRKMINESVRTDLREAYDGTTKFNIHRYVNGLIEEGQKNPQLMNFLLKYDKALNEGAKDFMLFERFGHGLARYAKANQTVKNVIKSMNETLAEYGNSLNGFILIESIEDLALREEVFEAYNTYLVEKNADTRDNLIESLEPLMMVSDPVAMQMQLLITEDTSMHPNFILTDFINESAQVNMSKKLQEAREQRQADEIFAKVEKYLDDKLNEEERLKLTEKEELCLNGIANNNGLDLHEELNKIAHSEAGKNERLMEVVNAYQNAINQGAYEERLYETLLSNISRFNYLVPVDKAIKSIHEKVDNKLEEITLTKLLEMMKEDNTSFIYVDLIQEDVARYVKNPNPTNRVQLRNALMPYASDPLINEMFNVLYADNTRRSNELSEKALNIKDQINIIRENATVSNIYSPVQYIKENESVFNVRGQYYVKKGNNISILDDKYVDQLNEKFTELCRLVNDPHVEINEDNIVLSGNDKYAIIYEGYVEICGHKESAESLRNLREMCMKYEDYDTNFYIMCSCLLENFNNIAKIDWAKHVTLNENHNINVDLFKLDQNIFMTTHNDSLGQNTFYRNINPIYCKTKLNEHMGINVSSLFTDLLPNQDKIILKLNETKNAYEDSIEQYEDMIDKLQDALDSASEENKEELETNLEAAKEKVEELKAEYKEWQEEVADQTGEETDSEDDDDETHVETSNEPLDDDEVEAAKDELSVPLSDTNAEDSEVENTDEFADEESDESAGITDDEFAEFIGSDDSDIENAENSTEDIFTSDDEETTEEPSEPAESETEFNAEDIFGSDENSDDIQDQEEFSTISLDSDTTEEPVDDEDIFEPEETEDTEVEGILGDDATDELGGNTADPLGVNDTIDSNIDADNVQLASSDETTDVDEEEPYQSKFSYKIADVMFDENVKDGTKAKSGTVIVVVPMVDGTGKKYIENQTIDFYLNDENMPILNNESMTNELYAAVVDAIKNSPDYTDVCENGVESEKTSLTNVVEPTEEWVDDIDYVEDENPAFYTEDERENAETPDIIDNAMDSINTTEEPDNAPVVMAPKKPITPAQSNKVRLDSIPTYSDGETEYELPASDADDSLIPESKEVKAKKALKESIKITPIFSKKTSGKSFFVNESAIKDSKNAVLEVAPLTAEKIDGSNINEFSEPIIDNEPIEDYDSNNDMNTLFKMHTQARYAAANAEPDGFNVEVSDIEEIDDLQYFTIGDDTDAYAVYLINSQVYFRDASEFFQILEDIKDEIRDSIQALTVSYEDVTVPVIGTPIENVDDCLFIISSIFSSITGSSYDNNALIENCKIKKNNKLQTDYDDEQSVKYDEAKNGTKSENDFKQEIEDKQKKDGTVGALDLQQQESEESIYLDDISEDLEQLIESKADEIYYEPNDIVYINGEKAYVTNVTEDAEGKQHLTVMKNGQIMQLEPSQVKPDPDQFKDLLDIEPRDQQDLELKQSKTDKMKDLNGKTVECNIVVDSTVLSCTLNGDKFKANLQDVLEGVDNVRVYVGDKEETWHKDNISIEPENWPHAVIANNEDEPLRKIKVNPTSYVNALEDDDLVDCLVADKLTQMPKKVIRIIS